MIDTYVQGRDLYAIIGTKVFHNGYWDNMEKHEDGSDNVDGKKRRSICKKLLLGIMYGESAASISEDLGLMGIELSVEEAQKLIDNLFKEFKKVKKWMDETEASAKKLGYVEDAWGRRRRLPDVLLPEYEVKFEDDSKNIYVGFNPIIGGKGIYAQEKPAIIQKYEEMLKSSNKKDYNSIVASAKKDGIKIKNNNSFIARAIRQSVNSRIQGGAASMSKKAMTLVYYDEEMRRLGFRLLIMVHDELIGECPEENVDAVRDRLAFLMGEAGKPICNIPMKCDAVEFKSWYLDEYQASIRKEYRKLISENSIDKSIEMLYNKYDELSIDEIRSIVA